VNGLNEAADGGATHPAHAILQGYDYDGKGYLKENPEKKFQFPCAYNLHTEWAKTYTKDNWWDGPHDLVPVPNENAIGNQDNIVRGGKIQQPLNKGSAVYRSRWFADVPLWPKANW
jgi:hypothetical protein